MRLQSSIGGEHLTKRKKSVPILKNGSEADGKYLGSLHSWTICVNIKYHTHHEMHSTKKCNSSSTSLDIWNIPLY